MPLKQLIEDILAMEEADWGKIALYKDGLFCDVGYALNKNGVSVQALRGMSNNDACTLVAQQYDVDEESVRDIMDINDRSTSLQRHKRALKHYLNTGEFFEARDIAERS